MEWTDERMDDLAARMDAGFARVDGDIRELRGEIRDLRGEVHRMGDGLRGEMHGIGDGLRVEIAALRSMMFRFELAMITAMAGLVAAVATGALGG